MPGSGVPFGEGLQLSAKMMTSLPPTLIGRMMPGAEAAELILQLVEGRRRLHKDEARLAVNVARLRQGNFGLNRAEGSTCRITATHLAAGVGGLGDTPCRRFQHVGSLHVAGILGLEPAAPILR
jgi:hypothetical protein